MLKIYIVETLEQMLEINELLHDELKGRAFARFWEIQQRQEKNKGIIKAVIQFDTKTRLANVFREIHGKKELLGKVPYNKALKFARENLVQYQTETGGKKNA